MANTEIVEYLRTRRYNAANLRRGGPPASAPVKKPGQIIKGFIAVGIVVSAFVIDILIKHNWGVEHAISSGLFFGFVLTAGFMILAKNDGMKIFQGIGSIFSLGAGSSPGNLKTFADDPKSLPFSLWLGESTGWLSQKYHGTGIAAGQQVALSLPDACQNILVLGGIGSGKTTRAMHPLLLQLLDQKCGGLIFDIKGDFIDAVGTFADAVDRPVKVIGVDALPINLLKGLTPEVASSFLKSIFMLSGHFHTDPFWIETATELCRNTLGVLSFVPQYYSLNGLYLYLFDEQVKLEIIDKVTAIAAYLDDRNKRLLRSYSGYKEKVFDPFDDKVKAGVNATIAQVLSPFNHPDLVDAFCTESPDNVAMEDVLNGAVYLVELPLSKWGLGGKVVYSMIKLRFFNVMQDRNQHPDWNQDRPVFFMCDEFQELVSANKDGLSDLNFWDKARSSKTIGIISGQAISSFDAAIGNRDIARALLQNFRQKISFKTEDTSTLQYFNSLADKVEVERKSYSSTSGRSSGSWKNGDSSHNSNTENVSIVDKPVIDAQLFRTMHPEQLLALLTIGGHSMDDVLNTYTIYVE